ILECYLIVYLNIEEGIRTIRFEDERKAVRMKSIRLTEVQADAMLNMRLRSRRKREEMESRKEHDNRRKRRDGLEKLIKSEARQWTKMKKEIGEIRKKFGAETALGARRTEIGKAVAVIDVANLHEAMIEKEPITVICSAKGWI